MDRTGSETSPKKCHKPTESLYNVDGNEPLQNVEQGEMSQVEQDLFIYHLLHGPSEEDKDISTEAKAREYKLREEEIVRKTLLRERNRIASHRFRRKIEQQIMELEQAINGGKSMLENYRGENQHMRQENINLKTEAQRYRMYGHNIALPYQDPSRQLHLPTVDYNGELHSRIRTRNSGQGSFLKITRIQRNDLG